MYFQLKCISNRLNVSYNIFTCLISEEIGSALVGYSFSIQRGFFRGKRWTDTFRTVLKQILFNTLQNTHIYYSSIWTNIHLTLTPIQFWFVRMLNTTREFTAILIDSSSPDAIWNRWGGVTSGLPEEEGRCPGELYKLQHEHKRFKHYN